MNDPDFETERLLIGEWRLLAERHALDLESVVEELLSPATTVALPPDWQGHYSRDRARRWIDERNAESPTLVVIDRETAAACGLVILFAGSTVESDSEVGSAAELNSIELRIGYLFDPAVWGRGLATETVAGLITWARQEPTISALVGGVARDNHASVRVLTANGFAPVDEDGHPGDEQQLFRLEIQ